jgi:hypothetical protein
MIVDLPNTTTAAISKKLVRLRQDVGAMCLGRVLTLVIVADDQTEASRLSRRPRTPAVSIPAASSPWSAATRLAPAGSMPRSGSAATPGPER